jgi:hypothetical protein
MSTPHQALLDKIKQLPAQRMAEVEDFIDFLRSREDERRLVRAADKARRAGLAAQPSDSAQPSLKGRFQGRAKAHLSIRDMDDAIAAAVVEAHNRISRHVK